MKMSWLHQLRGVVTIRITGRGIEELVNAAAADGLQLLGLRRTSREETVCRVLLRDYWRLRPYLRRTGCRMRIVAKEGAPFFLARIERRKFFIAGMALFVVGMYLLSSLVWRVEVKGNENLPEEQILQAARQEGIHPFQWSFRLKGADELSKRLTAKLPGTAWVGVSRQGTKITIEVVESTIPKPKELLSPRHLVAKADAVVTHVWAETGRPVVKKNGRVKKGDILISGTLGDEDSMQTVVAKGEVKGLVWHEYDIVSPLTRKAKVYTGERQIEWFAVAGGRALQVSGFGKPPFAKYEAVRREERAAWRGIELPFGRLQQTLLEVRYDERKVSEEEAAAEGLLQARADILSRAGADSSVRAEKILHQKTENGKVYMKVLFEVEQSIVTEMPLVELQGE